MSRRPTFRAILSSWAIYSATWLLISAAILIAGRFGISVYWRDGDWPAGFGDWLSWLLSTAEPGASRSLLELSVAVMAGTTASSVFEALTREKPTQS